MIKQVKNNTNETEYDIEVVAIQVDLDDPDQYKADTSGLASSNEYDTALSGIQADLDDPDQYKADTSGLASEATVSDIKLKTDTISWEDITFLKDVEGGKWKIIDNQMIFYKADNTTEIARFDLFNKFGISTTENVFERRRI